ncbi:hypothetical protein K438DRAFT_1763891 [Mycena galopus ATCC 62051]|nr:hypothetical protein K438DRAFT_1763891 [Mycena galopus ATCC 62051]
MAEVMDLSILHIESIIHLSQPARMLIVSPKFRYSNEVLTITAMLLVPNVWLRPNNQRREAMPPRSARQKLALDYNFNILQLEVGTTSGRGEEVLSWYDSDRISLPFGDSEILFGSRCASVARDPGNCWGVSMSQERLCIWIFTQRSSGNDAVDHNRKTKEIQVVTDHDEAFNTQPQSTETDEPPRNVVQTLAAVVEVSVFDVPIYGVVPINYALEVKTRRCTPPPVITRHHSITWLQKWKPEIPQAISLLLRTATRCTRCRPLPPPLTMSTSASSKSTGTRKNLGSGLIRLSNEAVPVLRLAEESVAGSGIPGPEAALGGVLAVAEMIQDMQSNKNDLAKLKPHLEELIKTDMSGCDGELKKRLTELALKLEPSLVKCDSLAAESGIKQIMRCKKYKEQIQSLRDDIASNIQEFTFYGSISIEKLVKDLVNTVEHVKKTVDEAKAGFKEVEGTVNGTRTPHYRGSDSQIVNNHFYGGKGGSGGGGGVQGHGGAGGAGEGPTLQIAYTAGTLTINNLPAGPAVVHAAQKAEFKELKGTVDETKGQRMYSISILRAIS